MVDQGTVWLPSDYFNQNFGNPTVSQYDSMWGDFDLPPNQYGNANIPTFRLFLYSGDSSQPVGTTGSSVNMALQTAYTYGGFLGYWNP